MLFSTARNAICSAAVLAAAQGAAAETNSFAARAQRAFNEAQQIVRREPTNAVALLALARASFDWAEYARKDSERADIAGTGIASARQVIDRSPTNAAAHYWLAMDLGQLARTKSLGALKLVREMEDELHQALALDEHVDFAGPDRSLGLLYRDAPGWPTSIGNKRKAREHLEHAVKLHPEFPDNQLALLESLDKWADRPGFERQMKPTEKSFLEAKEKFTGAEWEQSWADWKKRLTEMKAAQTPNRRGK